MAAHILIVEDHQDSARALAHLLRHEGLRVTVAGRLDEAVSLCRAERFDLLIVDLELPDGDGMALPELVKNSCPAPAVVLSANGGAEQQQEARRRGFADYLVKPVTWENLRFAILRALRDSPPPSTWLPGVVLV